MDFTQGLRLLETHANLWIPIFGLGLAFAGIVWKMSAGFSALKGELRYLGDRFERALEKQDVMFHMIAGYGERLAVIEREMELHHPEQPPRKAPVGGG